MNAPSAWWSLGAPELFRQFGSRPEGLGAAEAARRRAAVGFNDLDTARPLTRLGVLWGQLRSPLLFLLLFAVAASMATGQWVDAMIVLTIVIASVAFGYSREYRAGVTVATLRARVQTRASVWRDGRVVALPMRELVPGDIVQLSAGSLVPADAVLLDANDLYVNQATLTGESMPVAKSTALSPPAAALIERGNCVWLGTNVRSGAGRCLIVATGRRTAFGAIAGKLLLRPPETEFERGIRHFGYLMSSAMLVMVLCVFVVNMLFGRPPAETFLFAVALAVGLSPELLPAILSVNLARGAQMMARRGVLVRHLSAIENLGSVDVLCTDKTGTLTEGVVRLEGAYDADGARSAGSCGWRCATRRCRPVSPIRWTKPSCRQARRRGYSQAGRGSVRLRAQAAQRHHRRRRRGTADHQGGLRVTLAACDSGPDGRRWSDAERGPPRPRASKPGAARAYGCWPWRRAGCRCARPMGATTSAACVSAAS